MNPSHLLFVANDPVLTTCYGEALANAGFHVHAATDAETALKRLPEVKPRCVVLDLLLPGKSAAEMVEKIRNDRTTRHLPVIGLPTELEPLAQSALKAGLTKRLERFANPIATLVNAIDATLGHEEVAPRREHPHATPESVQRCAAAIGSRVPSLRHQLQVAAHPADRARGLRGLLQEIHEVVELCSILGWKTAFQLSAALETLIFDLERSPEQVSPSAMRTVGQGIDFLANVLADPAQAQQPMVADSQVFIIDDDANARQLMTAAMKLVNLSASSAGTPATGLAMLSRTPFDLLFLDVGLPEMNGFELCTKIRAIDAHKETPIVFITGMATFENRVQSSISGGNDFVGKPFNIAELGVKALLWVIRKRQERRHQ